MAIEDPAGVCGGALPHMLERRGITIRGKRRGRGMAKARSSYDPPVHRPLIEVECAQSQEPAMRDEPQEQQVPISVQLLQSVLAREHVSQPR